MPSKPADLPRLASHYIPEPTIIGFGPNPFTPCHEWNCRPDPPFHAPEDTRPAAAERKPNPDGWTGPNGYDRPFPRDGRCPTCAGRIGLIERYDPDGKLSWVEASWGHESHLRYCPWCDAMSPRNETRAAYQRAIREAWEDAETAAAEIASEFDALAASRKQLTELERRRLWNGYKGSFAAERPEDMIGSLAVNGREFLARVGQMPDFDLILDRRGRIVGRYSDEQTPIDEPRTTTPEDGTDHDRHEHADHPTPRLTPDVGHVPLAG